MDSYTKLAAIIAAAFAAAIAAIIATAIAAIIGTAFATEIAAFASIITSYENAANRCVMFFCNAKRNDNAWGI
jgi:hypothetical protein